MQVTKVNGEDRLMPTPAEFDKQVRRFSVEEYQEMNKAVTKTVALQKELGLGDPTQAEGILRTGLTRAMAGQEANALYDSKMFKYMEQPDFKTFPLFDRASGSGTMTSSSSFKTKPLFAIVKLGAGIRQIQCNADGSRFEAPIPVIPSAHLEMARRAKELAPSGEFHLAYQPSWELMPNRDPALFIVVDDGIANKKHWFLVGEVWGGDRELINEHLLEKK